MISMLQLEKTRFRFDVTANEINKILPKTLLVKTSCGDYGYDLVDSIGFLQKDGYLTLALDFKIDPKVCPVHHLDPKNIFPKDYEDKDMLNIENSMTLTAFVTINILMPNKGIKTDDGVLLYGYESKIDVIDDDNGDPVDLNIIKTSCIRLNRLGHYHNLYFCSAFRDLDIFQEYLKGTKGYSDSGMCMDMVHIDSSWEGISYDFISKFLKDGIVYDKGIMIARDKDDKRHSTSTVSLNSPMVDTNLHLLNSLCPTHIEPVNVFPYFKKSERDYFEPSEIFRIL